MSDYVCAACGHTHQIARLGWPCPELPAAPVPDVPEENEVRDELEEHAREEELAAVLALLRSDECSAILSGNIARAAYVVELIDRLLGGGHRS